MADRVQTHKQGSRMRACRAACEGDRFIVTQKIVALSLVFLGRFSFIDMFDFF